MRALIFFTSLLVSAACFAPHYTNWHGLKSDLSVKQQQAVRTLSGKAIYGLSPTRQIDAIRSWLEHGAGNVAFPGYSKILHDTAMTQSRSNCIMAILDELGINVKQIDFEVSQRQV